MAWKSRVEPRRHEALSKCEGQKADSIVQDTFWMIFEAAMTSEAIKLRIKTNITLRNDRGFAAHSPSCAARTTDSTRWRRSLLRGLRHAARDYGLCQAQPFEICGPFVRFICELCRVADGVNPIILHPPLHTYFIYLSPLPQELPQCYHLFGQHKIA